MTSFKRGYLLIGKKKSLEWVRIRNSCPKGLIFAPPLIGGDFSQQIILFRCLIRKNYDLISFNYSGHGNSTGKFFLEGSINDTFHMLSYVCDLAENERLSLYGIASCYSALPLIYSTYHLFEPFKRLVLINAIPKLSSKAVLKSFIAYYRKNFSSGGNRINDLLAALVYYMDFLFPGITKNENYFGILELRRAKFIKILTNFSL